MGGRFDETQAPKHATQDVVQGHFLLQFTPLQSGLVRVICLFLKLPEGM